MSCLELAMNRLAAVGKTPDICIHFWNFWEMLQSLFAIVQCQKYPYPSPPNLNRISWGVRGGAIVSLRYNTFHWGWGVHICSRKSTLWNYITENSEWVLLVELHGWYFFIYTLSLVRNNSLNLAALHWWNAS